MKNDLAPYLAQEVTLTLPLSAVLRLVDEPTSPAMTTAELRPPLALPAIGAKFEGGVYAGLSIENERPVALILLPNEEDLTWQQAKEWADKSAGVLPSRFDLLVLLKNLRHEFKTDDCYWSADEFADYAEYAWVQNFSYGYQDYWPKSRKCRARAVRRVQTKGGLSREILG